MLAFSVGWLESIVDDDDTSAAAAAVPAPVEAPVTRPTAIRRLPPIPTTTTKPMATTPAPITQPAKETVASALRKVPKKSLLGLVVALLGVSMARQLNSEVTKGGQPFASTDQFLSVAAAARINIQQLVSSVVEVAGRVAGPNPMNQLPPDAQSAIRVIAHMAEAVDKQLVARAVSGLFSLADADANGSLNQAEIIQLLEASKSEVLDIRDATITARLIQLMDQNSDGTLDLKELTAFAARHFTKDEINSWASSLVTLGASQQEERDRLTMQHAKDLFTAVAGGELDEVSRELLKQKLSTVSADDARILQGVIKQMTTAANAADPDSLVEIDFEQFRDMLEVATQQPREELFPLAPAIDDSADGLENDIEASITPPTKVEEEAEPSVTPYAKSEEPQTPSRSVSVSVVTQTPTPKREPVEMEPLTIEQIRRLNDDYDASKAWAQRAWERINPDQTDSITIDALVDAIPGKTADNQLAMQRTAANFDTNNDGRLTFTEFHTFVRAVLLRPPVPTQRR
jgi:Ca2+-binding EF-hand superfamily protein